MERELLVRVVSFFHFIYRITVHVAYLTELQPNRSQNFT